MPTESPELMSMEDLLKTMRRWDDEGVTRTEIARRIGKSRERVRQMLGNVQRPQDRRERRLYISDEAWDACEKIARERFDLVLLSGPNRGDGAINRMLEMIGSGQLKVSRK